MFAVSSVDVTSVTSFGVILSVCSCEIEWDGMVLFETSEGAGSRVMASQCSRNDSEALSEMLSMGEREDPDSDSRSPRTED